MTRLVGAIVQRRDSDVVLKWTIEGDPEVSSSPWLLTVGLFGGDDGPLHQFGLRFRDGKLAERFHFDFVAGKNYYSPTVSARQVGDTWTAIFPAGDEVARVGAWRAALTFDDANGNAHESRVEGVL